MQLGNKIKLLGGTTLAGVGLTYYLWCHRNDIKKGVIEWKNDSIRNAYYDTLTEKDIAWG